MGTYNRASDTCSPLGRNKEWAEKHKAKWGIYPICGAENEGTLTLTQVELDQKISDAVTSAKESIPTGLEGLGEGVKDHPSITRYKSVEELAKGHLELEKTVGLKGVLVPSDGSSDEVKANFYKAIGRPELAEGYSNPVVDNLHAGVKAISEANVKGYKEKAFELGLSEKQAKGIMDWHLGLSSQRLTDWDKLQEDEKNTAATALRNRWGASYDEKLALSNGLIKKFGNKDLISKLEESGFGSNPDVIELLASIGTQLSEDTLGDLGRSGMGMTPEQAKLEISTVTKQIMETKQDDPIYKELLRKKDSLYKIAYPSGTPA